MLARYFQEELEYLRELAREFAKEHPTLAPALAERGSDPDVERILEGTAYLTGAIRKKLDDDLPEFTQALIQMVWPHYLRPVPSSSVVEFTHPAQPKVGATEWIPAGEAELESVPVDGTRCRFRTCFGVAFHPLVLERAELEPGGSGALRLGLRLVGGAKPEDVRGERLRLYLDGDLGTAATLYLWLVRHAREVALEVAGEEETRRRTFREEPVRPAGFLPEEGLFPYPQHAFLGYRLLQEYFTLPQKFLFVDVAGLSALAELAPEERFDLVFRFGERPPDDLHVSAENLRLHCTPVVNLFARDADPIRMDQRRSRYFVRAAAPQPAHYEVYSVDRVEGLAPGAGRREYRPFHSFRAGMVADDGPAAYYQLHRRPSVSGPNSDCYLSFVTDEAPGADGLQGETISVELTCTNRRLAETLRPGDICQHGDRSPQFADFRSLTVPTASVMPPLEGDFHWRLISHLSLNYVSLQSAETLQGLLGLYNLAHLHDRQVARANELRIRGVAGVESRPAQRVLRGAPVRGMETRLDMLEEHFASEGEMFLFANVLEEFLSLYVTVNAYSRLTVRGVQKGEVYEWPARIGKQFTL